MARSKHTASDGFPGLPHLDARGAARMVDVGQKQVTHRVAVAEALIRLQPDTLGLLQKGGVAKGDALAVARIAGIIGSKKVAELIPLAHPLALEHVAVDVALRPDLGGVRVEARVECHGVTGVEMEALTAASVAALALYDMVKRHERGAVIERVQLLEKSGGVTGSFSRPEEERLDAQVAAKSRTRRARVAGSSAAGSAEAETNERGGAGRRGAARPGSTRKASPK